MPCHQLRQALATVMGHVVMTSPKKSFLLQVTLTRYVVIATGEATCAAEMQAHPDLTGYPETQVTHCLDRRWEQ